MPKPFAPVRGRDPGVRIVDNPDYEQGQLTSLLAGLRAIDAARATAALVTLIDVPLVSAATVRTLIAAQRERGAPIVRPVSNGRHGHPVIFGRALFEELQRADPAQGAKPVVRAHAAEMVEVPIDDEGAFTDIDTREDYENSSARGNRRESGQPLSARLDLFISCQRPRFLLLQRITDGVACVLSKLWR